MTKLIATIVCVLIFASTAFASNYPDISIEELQKLIEEKKVVILDLNGTESYQKNHIRGAFDCWENSAGIEEFINKTSDGNKEMTVVAYCTNPFCKAYIRGADAAVKAGYKDVRHLSVGISGWMNSGAKTDSISKN
jgi:rhodanese-related sulfurtransferase